MPSARSDGFCVVAPEESSPTNTLVRSPVNCSSPFPACVARPVERLSSCTIAEPVRLVSPSLGSTNARMAVSSKASVTPATLTNARA
eukprot:684117-Prorocentrum_minimum.AAC.4